MEKSAKTRRLDPPTEEPIDSLGRYSFLEPGVEENPYERPPSSRGSHPSGDLATSSAQVEAPEPKANWLLRAAEPKPTSVAEHFSVQDEKRFEEVSRISVADAEPIPLLHPRPTVMGARFVRSRTRAYANTLPFLSDEGAQGLAPSPDTIDIRVATPNSLALASMPMIEDVPTSEAYTAHGLYLHPDTVNRLGVEDRLPRRAMGSTVLLALAVVVVIAALMLTILAERL
jgi:hypothetical protein